MLEYWNNLKKPDNVNVKAVKGDIVEKIDGVLFLLQTTIDYNNVVAYRVEPSDRFIIWTFYKYCILLHDKYHIDYIRVEGDINKYKFLEKLGKKITRKDNTVKTRDVYYCNLKTGYKIISLKSKEFEFYYVQHMYRKTHKKEYYDKMFFHVRFAVENCIKKRLGRIVSRGTFRPNLKEDVYDFTMTATCKIMSRYTKGDYEIRYLLTTADYAALEVLHNVKQKLIDQTLSYESYIRYEMKNEN